jgi:hypothetical protein
MSSTDFERHVSGLLLAASESAAPISSLEEVVRKSFSGLRVEASDNLLRVRLESSVLEIRVVKRNEFRIFENNHPTGGSLADYSAGKPCTANELFRELVGFSGVVDQ